MILYPSPPSLSSLPPLLSSPPPSLCYPISKYIVYQPCTHCYGLIPKPSSFPLSPYVIPSLHLYLVWRCYLNSTQECHSFLRHSSAYAGNGITLGFGTPALAQFPGIGNWEVVVIDWCQYSLQRCQLMSLALIWGGVQHKLLPNIYVHLLLWYA